MNETQQRYNKKELIIGVVIKIVAAIASIYGMSRTIRDLQAFTYFTNLSNIMIDIVLLMFAYIDIRILVSKGKKNCKKNWMYIFKFVVTISITITCAVYLTLLAPTNEKGMMYAYFSNGAGSFCVHMFTPVLAIIDYVMFDYGYESVKKHALFATIPPLSYVGFVVIISSLGMRWGDNMYAPYNFMNYGAKTGWFGFDLSLISSETLGIGVAYAIVGLFFLFWGVGLGYLAIKNLRRKAKLKAIS